MSLGTITFGERDTEKTDTEGGAGCPRGVPPADLTTPIHRQPQRFEGASQRRRNERSPLYPSPPGADRNPSPDLCRQGLCSKKCGAVPVRAVGSGGEREACAKSRTQKRSVNQVMGTTG